MVMTIRVMSAGRGYEYLLKSVAAGDGDREIGTPLTRYYSQSGTPPGTWVGSGLGGIGGGNAGRIAAGDRVTEEQLARLLGSGLDPVTGAKLGAEYPQFQPPARRIAARVARMDATLDALQRAQQVAAIRVEESHRVSRTPVAGFDLTFSPPKSLSALWGVADAGTQALLARSHHEAMHDTIALLEDRVAATRVGHGGIARMPVTGVIAVAFDHYDTRAGDPQLHTHLVVSNKVQGIDGKWRTLDSRALHKATVALSASYNAFLTDHTARLLGVTWVPVDRGRDRNTGWEIDGVPTGLLAEFSRRTRGMDGVDGIEQVKDQLIAEYITEHGRTPSARIVAKLRQQATLQTRPDKELHSLAGLTADWRARATVVLGQDATPWAQELLAHLVEQAVLRADDLQLARVHDIAAVMLMEVGNRRATWGRYNLHAETMRQLMGIRFATTADRQTVADAVVNHAEAISVRLTPEYDRTLPALYREVDGSNRFQPFDTITYTSQNVLDAETRLLEYAMDESGSPLAARLVNWHTSRPIRGVKLADDQVAAIGQIARSGRVLDLLIGPAGTGKTTALRALHRAWTAAHGKNSVIGLAPSAAAADVLGTELGVQAENTAKFLHEHQHGRWDLKKGQLVLVDEASLAGTLVLDRIVSHAANVGAKVVLIGDWAQLSAVEASGAFGMLARAHPDAPELIDVRRFRAEWEKTASLGLRHGDPTVLDTYAEHDRIHDGDTETMIAAAYQAWQVDRAAGRSTLMIAATSETVAELNLRARADLAIAGTVDEPGVELHDGTTAGVGDLIVTRLNDRRLITGAASWVKNGDRWQVTGQFEEGSLTARRIGRDDRPHGSGLVLPASYVASNVELGYASTVHCAQGSNVDTAHTIIDPATATRELLYVATTRARDANHLYVATDTHGDLEPHHDLLIEQTAVDLLAKVLARPGTEESATETLKLAVDEHASLTTIINEYETIAADAQADRWAAVIDAAPLPADLLDTVFTSSYYPALETTLRRAESHGHDPATILATAATGLAEDQASDPAITLARKIEKSTARPRGGTPRRIAGLIPRAIGPMSDDMRTALAERERLIEQAAQKITIDDVKAGAAWIKRLGSPGRDPRKQAEWFCHAVTIRLYRQRRGLTGLAPLGNPDDVRGLEQTYEYRAARAALNRARYLTRHLAPRTTPVVEPSVRRGRGIGL